jgi:hypothetical protein
MSALKVIQFSDYRSMPIGSQAAQKGENLSSQGDSENLAKSPGIWASKATQTLPSGRTRKNPIKPAIVRAFHHETKVSRKPPKASKKTKVSPQTPAPAPTAGPEDHKIDIVEMTFGQPKAAYHGEFQSWKNGKSRGRSSTPTGAAPQGVGARKYLRHLSVPVGPQTLKSGQRLKSLNLSPAKSLDPLDFQGRTQAPRMSAHYPTQAGLGQLIGQNSSKTSPPVQPSEACRYCLVVGRFVVGRLRQWPLVVQVPAFTGPQPRSPPRGQLS